LCLLIRGSYSSDAGKAVALQALDGQCDAATLTNVFGLELEEKEFDAQIQAVSNPDAYLTKRKAMVKEAMKKVAIFYADRLESLMASGLPTDLARKQAEISANHHKNELMMEVDYLMPLHWAQTGVKADYKALTSKSALFEFLLVYYKSNRPMLICYWYTCECSQAIETEKAFCLIASITHKCWHVFDPHGAPYIYHCAS